MSREGQNESVEPAPSMGPRFQSTPGKKPSVDVVTKSRTVLAFVSKVRTFVYVKAVLCPTCQSTIALDEAFVNYRLTCPKCGVEFHVD